MNKINEDNMFATGGGMDNTLFPASYSVQGALPGYTYSILPFNDTLQQKKNTPSEEYYIYPGCTVRGVGFNNPDKHYTGIVNRIIKDANGEVVALYIQCFKTSKLVSIRPDDNLELIIHKDSKQVGMKTQNPEHNLSLNQNIVRESMQEGFALSRLDDIKDFGQRIIYCNQYLGEPVGSGADRLVFEVGDDTIIKILKHGSNLNQNFEEYQNYVTVKRKYPDLVPLFPKVYQIAKDYTWIEEEKVIPVNSSDIKKVLGIPLYVRDGVSLAGFIDWAENPSIEGELPNTINFRGFENNEEYVEEYEELMRINPWFKLLYRYIELCDYATDLHSDNFGLAERDGKPYIVILDSGFDDLARG